MTVLKIEQYGQLRAPGPGADGIETHDPIVTIGSRDTLAGREHVEAPPVAKSSPMH